jgi:D-alanyl-D-alanine carboxypeptidase/D-alanyl-D-alanine-endopeptidase (penicillin-binding protein 4)
VGWRGVFLALALGLAAPAAAQAPLGDRVEAKLREAGAGTRFGLVVATEDGRELVAIAPEARFIPASNTKMFTTAAAFHEMAGLDAPDVEAGAAVRLEGGRRPDVILEGRGDARLSSAPDCVSDCLAALADAVARRTRRVRNVVGDDTLFLDQRWSPGMSWNNIPTRSGTAISALTLDDNELRLTVSAGPPGGGAKLDHSGYFQIDNRVVTVAGGETDLDYYRMPGSRRLLLTGTIAEGAEPQTLRLGIDDPAHYAAWRLKALLEARGVRVSGIVAARHRAPALPRATASGEPLARASPPSLVDDVSTINKASQNLHAELLLRRLGLKRGSGSIEDGIAALRSMLETAGLARTQYDFSDGSGMSTYNRLAPRGVVRFLGWASAQPWGRRWRETLPVAGVDGTLANRFRGTPLEGRLFAKTGSLNATSALSGYMVAKSGRTLLFSIFANDIPEGQSAQPVMDSALVLIASEN